MKASTLLLTLVLPVTCSFAQEAPEALASLKGAYEKESLAALDPLTKRYVDSLHSLKLKYTQSGDLEGALAVDGEIKRMADNGGSKHPSTGDPIPADLAALRNIYIDAASKAVGPLTGSYITSLEAMKLKFTQLGKLEEAVAVDNELKRQTALVQAASPKASADKIDTAKLAELKWRMPEKLLPGGESSRQWVQFAPNGRLVCGWNTANFNWKPADDGSVLFYPFKNRQKAVKFEWDNESPTATISTEDSSHKVTQFRR
ncbi:hypothetical protein OVA24_13825 [Luteolibacter sp. SL250]|uniref:hypothetical protein n=1 Tax=Luteolibacter sp. SL250 TaxID=2995170 RepID=UPI00226FA62C|nr:hypothetical protein [Luteolibacter sp. SL250]WAC18313.1 hypothetical protein OVA24_13825 [Luteolibacter sp. SL250]